jgi:hypothetical protein
MNTKPSQTSTSIMLRKKNSTITSSKLRESMDVQSIIRNPRTTLKLSNEKIPFSENRNN